MTSSISRLDKNFEIPNVDKPMDWYDLADLPTEGQGWPGQAPGRYGRLPAKAKAVVRDPVWNLGLHSAGMAIRFVTDASEIAGSWDVINASALMPHMAPTGTSGVDLYVWKDERWRWCGSGRPDTTGKTITFTNMLLESAVPAKRTYTLYLPLYNGVSGVRIGVTPGSLFEAAPARSAGKDKPICFYGTSITQGGCASRPGMAYPSIIGRYLDLPQINLGFSGNGKMEPEMAELLAQIDPCLFVLDPVGNNTEKDVQERGEPLIQTLRKTHPTTPIVMVEYTIPQNAHMVPAGTAQYLGKNKAWRVIYDSLIKQGDQNLYYIPCDDLYGDDDESTVDGGHATDLGFYRMAQAITPVLKNILENQA